MSGTVGTNSSRRSGSIGTAAAGATISASDPAIDTNPADGVGTQWANSTSGEFYVCTDATAGSNVWTNVGAGTGDIEPWQYGGTNYGYSMGWYPATNQIQKWSFSSDGDSTDAGNLSVTKAHASGAQNATHGYSAGGATGGNVIDKFEFSSDGDSTDVGNLTHTNAHGAAGQSSETHGFAAGGYQALNIEKWAFASDGDATNTGELTDDRMALGAASSTLAGYSAGGHSGPGPRQDIIDKHLFASEGNATDVGNLHMGIDTGLTGSSSSTYGYAAGGVAHLVSINKWSFSSDGDATDVGDLTTGTGAYGGDASSQTYGYCAGGGTPSRDVIDKYSFSSDGAAVDVGNLLAVTLYNAGTQY